jgi:hypothetical protein
MQSYLLYVYNCFTMCFRGPQTSLVQVILFCVCLWCLTVTSPSPRPLKLVIVWGGCAKKCLSEKNFFISHKFWSILLFLTLTYLSSPLIAHPTCGFEVCVPTFMYFYLILSNWVPCSLTLYLVFSICFCIIRRFSFTLVSVLSFALHFYSLF